MSTQSHLGSPARLSGWDKVQISTMPSRLFLIVSGRRMLDREVASDARCRGLANCACRPALQRQRRGPVDHPKTKSKSKAQI